MLTLLVPGHKGGTLIYLSYKGENIIAFPVIDYYSLLTLNRSSVALTTAFQYQQLLLLV